MAEERVSRFNYRQWSFDYSDIMKATGLSQNLVQQHRKRGKFNPEDFDSLVIYLAKHARPELRMAILEASLLRDSAEVTPGTFKKKKAEKKKRVGL